MERFEVGKTYTVTSICDHECVFSFRINRRTAKSVWITGGRVHNERRKISIWDGSEVIYPLGKYSMAPMLRA